MKEFLLSTLSGITSSLIAFWVTTFVSNLSTRDKWLISGLVGLIILVIVAVIFRRSSSGTKQSRSQTAWGIKGGKVQVGKVKVNDNYSQEVNTVGDISAKGSVVIEDVDVKHKRK